MALVADQALTHWQVTPLSETAYDVPDAPMQGEMDSTFFLTRDRNVIPHTYPCRTAYIAEVRGKAPQPFFAPDWSTARNVLPMGSAFLDLSGFWFRATRLGGWARTAVRAQQAGIARLRLGICGAARLVANGQAAGWLSPATRNAMEYAEFDVSLAAGDNEIAVWFEDLAERDAVLRIHLVWLSGPVAEAAFPYGADPATVAAVEASLGAMHLDRHHYDRDDTIRLVLPVPFPATVDGRVTVAGHFMTHDSQSHPLRIPAGAEGAALCDAAGIAADFRYFHFDIACNGFSTSARLGAEVSHAAALGAAPGPQAARIAEALAWIAADAEADTEKALACLDIGSPASLAEAIRAIGLALPAIEECRDCADFALVPLIWARSAYGDLLPEALCARIDRAMLAYRYWMDEPGNDVQWYFSENHALLFHTACYLAGLHLPDDTFVRSQRTGRAQSEAGAARLHGWFDHFERAEMAEFNSAPYFPIDLKGLTTLYALAPDGDLRQRAAQAIERLVTIMANSAHHGVMTGAQGRSYEHSLCATDTLELTGIARLLWGLGGYGAHVNCLAQLALCLRDHGLVLPDLAARAAWAADTAQEWTFWQGQNAFCRLYHHKTAETALGSAALYRWGDWGYQETLVHARIGRNPRAQVWVNHPGEMVQSGYGRPSYWGGSANVPRVQQYRDLAIVIFDGVAPQIGFTHAWFPTEAFDEWQVTGGSAVACAGRGLVALRGAGPLELQTTGGAAGAELRQPGRGGRWVLRVGMGDSAPGFAERHALDLTEGPGGAFRLEDPDYGTVIFRADGRVEAEGRVLDPRNWTMQGERRELPL
ncbi:hypothetical protein [Tropicimonas sp.]|uniref:hypothetical protein n=1 Tax=Tropicimonas sp. TaxID=2067044 RepID=UPI003A839D80